MNKKQRGKIYDYLNSKGFFITKEIRQELRELLRGEDDEDLIITPDKEDYDL